MNEILKGHVSPETAYIVNDYPYGFRLRCKMRYWLEFKPGKGVRLVSQSSNPKVAGEVWNKPHASTYSRFGGAMFLDDAKHVKWSGLNEYCTAAEAIAWRDQFGAGVPEAARETLDLWIVSKLAYDAARAEGQSVAEASIVARVAAVIEASTLTIDKAREGLKIKSKAHNEWGKFVLSRDGNGWVKTGDSGSSMLDEGEFHFWFVCKQD